MDKKKIFDFYEGNVLGRVNAVDTGKVGIAIENDEILRTLQVNRLVAVESPYPGHYLVGMVTKIMREEQERPAPKDGIAVATVPPESIEVNLAEIYLVGTFMKIHGGKKNVFSRSLQVVPSIDAYCFQIEDENLTGLMRSVKVSSDTDGATSPLELGDYSLGDSARAILNGDRFFQRHALIVGSTGSGKSWTTARIIEKMSELPNANAILFDLHGEYSPLQGDGIKHFRIAGPQDLGKTEDDILYLPYWLLSSEAMISLFVDRSDQNAPNQAMIMDREVTNLKEFSQDEGDIFTVDSPIPFKIDDLLKKLKNLNKEMVKGDTGKEKQGPFHGRLSRLIQRLENKRKDRRLGFLFEVNKTLNNDWLVNFCKKLFSSQDEDKGIKIVDFSEVPSDILPLAVSLLAQVGFSLQQWTPTEQRHPLAFLCDEAHLYMPNDISRGGTQLTSLNIFERIAKEGRKYGLGLVIISQRPSEVNVTVLSQCNNFVAMRLTNPADQHIIQRLLPESVGRIADSLPILDTGEAIVVGDASLLPTRVKVSPPENKPNSGTVNFWQEWEKKGRTEKIEEAVNNWRRQSTRDNNAD